MPALDQSTSFADAAAALAEALHTSPRPSRHCGTQPARDLARSAPLAGATAAPLVSSNAASMGGSASSCWQGRTPGSRGPT